MYKILIDKKEYQIGQPLPAIINTLEIFFSNSVMPYPREQKQLIVSWLTEAVNKCKNRFISFNNVLILKKDVNLEIKD